MIDNFSTGTAHDFQLFTILHWIVTKKNQDNKVFLSGAGMLNFFSQPNTFKSAK